MTDLNKSSRRQFLKVGGAALVALPLIGLSGTALAAKNESVRAALQYQEKAADEKKKCILCANYQGAVDKPGACTLYPGDTEISPDGTCSAFIVKK